MNNADYTRNKRSNLLKFYCDWHIKGETLFNGRHNKAES